MFRAPSPNASSTPNSSPGRYDPSTTPAGPPPGQSFSYIPSSTPAGPPPSRLFGSPHANALNKRPIDFNRPTLNSSPPKNELTGIGTGLFGTPTSARPGYHRGRNSGTFRVPSSPPRHEEDEDEEEGSDSAGEDMEEEYDDEDMDDAEGDSDDYHNDARLHPRNRDKNKTSQSAISRNSFMQEFSSSHVQPAAKQSQHDLLSLAKGLAPNNADLREADEVILATERLLEKLHDSLVTGAPGKRENDLSEVAQELLAVWQASSPSLPLGSFPAVARSAASVNLSDANRLVSLVLGIHHPSLVAQRGHHNALSLMHSRTDQRQYTPIPKILIDWLNNHGYIVPEVNMVLRERGGYSAHEHFWTAVLASTVRGKFADTLKLLKNADFSVAETAANDGLGDSGYRGDHLFNANQAVQTAIRLIEDCPAVTSDDWDVKGADWSIFRRRVYLALKDLEDFAEGDSQNRQSFSQQFQASHFGISQAQNSFNLSVASRKAESKVPWSIYENLGRLYSQLLGAEEEILAVAADWIEAVIGLTVWWTGDEADGAQGSLAVSRRSVSRSQRVRAVDITPVKAYCQRLSGALAAVLHDEELDFSINTTDRTEVGLACIFDDNIEGVLQILRSWSLLVASAVGEIAANGDWLRRADGLLDQFDEEDLMVLSYNEEPRGGISKDDLLVAYAEQLASKATVTSQDGKTAQEGWELAIRVLDRLDDQNIASNRIADILHNLKLESPERVDKITRLCYGMGLHRHAQDIALTYAEHLRSNTQNYGDTLLYYARAHEATKIQEVLRVLVAHCLVKSVAYPPLDLLDQSLKSLITSPKQALTKLASLDSEGAQLLSTHLSGYATIRKFYDLRDEGVLAKDGEKPTHRPMARKRAAANALMVIISSAASSIRGGLYDPEVETVVQVDVLLALLGEALLFVNQPKRSLTLQHLYSLLAAVEDLDTAPGMIRAQCEEVLSTTLAAAYEGQSHRSTSDLTTASSQFSLIGSMASGSSEGQSVENSAVLVKGGKVDDTKRAWDWRKGFNKNATGKDVIRVLRLEIAREMARAFSGGDV